jgi:UDPglucose--hexose-1-phosphate uridylyltransferase
MPAPTELRQDLATRNWVVIAPERGRRPRAFRGPRGRQSEHGDCPFCPGREADTPEELWRIPAGGPWQVRVVPNKFPVLAGDGSARRRVSPEGFVAMPGAGRHEVVVEMPEHDGDLARADQAAVRRVLEAYRARYRALRASGAAVILIFRNHGPGAGTSLAHPHSQIVAAPVVPVGIRQRFEVAMRHYDDLGTCLYVDILERELRDGRRIVLETPRFVAFQPFASASPFETWIMPRFHQPSFGQAADDVLDDLAPVLRAVLGGLHRELGDPDYNYVLQSAPPVDEDLAYFVWHLRIVPRITTPAGFELGSGMPVNPSSPEETAAALRRAIREASPPARA